MYQEDGINDETESQQQRQHFGTIRCYPDEEATGRHNIILVVEHQRRQSVRNGSTIRQENDDPPSTTIRKDLDKLMVSMPFPTTTTSITTIEKDIIPEMTTSTENSSSCLSGGGSSLSAFNHDDSFAFSDHHRHHHDGNKNEETNDNADSYFDISSLNLDDQKREWEFLTASRKSNNTNDPTCFLDVSQQQQQQQQQQPSQLDHQDGTNIIDEVDGKHIQDDHSGRTNITPQQTSQHHHPGTCHQSQYPITTKEEQLPSVVTIAVAPGLTLPLRGSDETWKAITDGRTMMTKCCTCNSDLHCIEDAKFVLCPDCWIVSPVDQLPNDTLSENNNSDHRIVGSNHHSYGVGLGVKGEEVIQWIEQWFESDENNRHEES